MKSKTTSTNSAPTWALPGLQNAANVGQQVFNRQQPILEDASSDLFNIYGQMSQTAFNNPFVQNAQGVASGIMGGGGANPYLDDMIDNSADDVRSNVGGLFSRSGMYGSTPHQGVLAREIGRMSSGMRYNDYNTQQGRQMQALAAVPSLAGAQYAGVNPALSTLGIAAGLPFEGVDSYGRLMGNLVGNQGAQTQSGGGSTLGKILGGAMMAGQMFGISDVRLKENIRRVGATDAGQSIYTYTYRGDSTPHMGVMAQESPPDAVAVHPSGYLMVDYGKVR